MSHDFLISLIFDLSVYVSTTTNDNIPGNNLKNDKFSLHVKNNYLHCQIVKFIILITNKHNQNISFADLDLSFELIDLDESSSFLIKIYYNNQQNQNFSLTDVAASLDPDDLDFVERAVCGADW